MQVINWLILQTKYEQEVYTFFQRQRDAGFWDEEHNKWWFSTTDIVRAINDEEDYVKAGNYWRWMKKKLTADGIQLVSVTHDFKTSL